MRIAMFSGGAASYVSAKYGEVDILLFADTGMESTELYEFIEVAALKLKTPLIKVGRHGGMKQLIADHRALPSSRMPFCSIELKVQPCKKWLDENHPGCTIILGIAPYEFVRTESITANWNKSGYKVEYPLLSIPPMTASELIAEAMGDGLPCQSLYAKGFPHNNCGGGCVKAGQAQWARLLATNPNLYKWWEARESEVTEIHQKPCTVLKDRRGGVVRPLPLSEFRARVTGGLFDSLEWGGCGCFLEEPTE